MGNEIWARQSTTHIPLATEISKLNTKLDAMEQLLEQDYEEWTRKEKQKFGNHKQL
jgi:hypothetical protein